MFLLSFTFSMCCFPHNCDPWFHFPLFSYDLETGIMWNFSVDSTQGMRGELRQLTFVVFFSPFLKRQLWPRMKVQLRELAVGHLGTDTGRYSGLLGLLLATRIKGTANIWQDPNIEFAASQEFFFLRAFTQYDVGLDFPNSLKKMAVCIQKKGCEPESFS